MYGVGELWEAFLVRILTSFMRALASRPNTFVSFLGQSAFVSQER